MLGFGFGLNKWRRLGGGYVGLLDLFPNAAAAYSLRKLRAAYSGAAVRVRESGGNTEADIGFDANGDLDTTALLAHCGANDGFVTVWYDQSLSNDATQSTAADQPKIVSGGSLVTENGKAAIQFDGVNDYLIYSSLAFSNGSMSIFSVRKSSNNTSSGAIFDSADNQTFALGNGFRFDNFGDNARIGTQQTFTTFANASANQQLMSGLATSTVRKLFLDGSEVASNSGSYNADFTGVTQHKIGAMTSSTNQSVATNPFTGNMQEITVYNSDQSANRTGIETNINDFYSIF